MTTHAQELQGEWSKLLSETETKGNQRADDAIEIKDADVGHRDGWPRQEKGDLTPRRPSALS